MKKKLSKIVIIGAGGFGSEVLWTLNDINKQNKQFEILGFLDDDKSTHGKRINKKSVLGGLNFLDDHKDLLCVVAIGDGKIRQQITKKIEKNVQFPTLIHPSVIKSDFVEIGEGTIIQAGCILTTDVSIGKHVQINLSCTIGHGCKINDFVTFSPGVHINGQNDIKKGSYFGSGAITRDTIEVGQWSIIGAGSVLVNNVPSNSLWTGIPGKLIKKLNSKNRPKL